MKKLSEKEKQHRAKEASRKTAEARQALDEKDARVNYQRFMERFAICEVGYKSLLSAYLSDLEKEVKQDDLHINTRQVPSVLKRSGITLNEAAIKTLFNGKQKIGDRYARGIRNSLSHSPNKKALDELEKKLPLIENAMDEFEEAINKAAGEQSA